jgi:hypothetical protein
MGKADVGRGARSLELEMLVTITLWVLGMKWRMVGPQLRRCGACASCTAICIHLLAESRGRLR